MNDPLDLPDGALRAATEGEPNAVAGQLSPGPATGLIDDPHDAARRPPEGACCLIGCNRWARAPPSC